jgi:hypothetical protein
LAGSPGRPGFCPTVVTKIDVKVETVTIKLTSLLSPKVGVGEGRVCRPWGSSEAGVVCSMEIEGVEEYVDESSEPEVDSREIGTVEE